MESGNTNNLRVSNKTKQNLGIKGQMIWGEPGHHVVMIGQQKRSLGKRQSGKYN